MTVKKGRRKKKNSGKYRNPDKEKRKEREKKEIYRGVEEKEKHEVKWR